VDHPVALRGMKAILKEHCDLRVGGETSQPREVFRLLRAARLSLVVFEMCLTGISEGLAFLEEVRSKFPNSSVLVYTILPAKDSCVRVLKAGAAGYLHKNSSERELVIAIRKLLAGDRYLPASLEHQLAFLMLDGKPALTNSVAPSNREMQVLKGLADGKPLKEIAEKLSLSPKTVTAYRTRLLQKMQMKSNADLIRFVEQNPGFV
jgi:two-component system invasion response regulator UvrY